MRAPFSLFPLVLFFAASGVAAHRMAYDSELLASTPVPAYRSDTRIELMRTLYVFNVGNHPGSRYVPFEANFSAAATTELKYPWEAEGRVVVDTRMLRFDFNASAVSLDPDADRNTLALHSAVASFSGHFQICSTGVQLWKRNYLRKRDRCTAVPHSMPALSLCEETVAGAADAVGIHDCTTRQDVEIRVGNDPFVRLDNVSVRFDPDLYGVIVNTRALPEPLRSRVGGTEPCAFRAPFMFTTTEETAMVNNIAFRALRFADFSSEEVLSDGATLTDTVANLTAVIGTGTKESPTIVFRAAYGEEALAATRSWQVWITDPYMLLLGLALIVVSFWINMLTRCKSEWYQATLIVLATIIPCSFGTGDDVLVRAVFHESTSLTLSGAWMLVILAAVACVASVLYGLSVPHTDCTLRIICLCLAYAPTVAVIGKLVISNFILMAVVSLFCIAAFVIGWTRAFRRVEANLCVDGSDPTIVLALLEVLQIPVMHYLVIRPLVGDYVQTGAWVDYTAFLVLLLLVLTPIQIPKKYTPVEWQEWPRQA